MSKATKNIVLFVNAIRPATFTALENLRQKSGHSLTPVVLVDESIRDSIQLRNKQHLLPKKVRVISADFDSPKSVRQALLQLQDKLFAVTAQYENSITELRKLIPFVPYLPTPSERSLEWATEKKLMRSLFTAYDPSLAPAFMEVTDATTKTIAQIEAALSYPVIIKPSGLEGSLLVSQAQNRVELIRRLRHTFAEIQTGYDTWIKRQTPTVLVEEFMVGDMYSVDTYLGPAGEPYHTPMVKIVTGHKVGFDDFFGYVRLAPSGLSQAEEAQALSAATKACRALGLRAVTAHTELMKTSQGWKIIEVGPRIGGYRHDMYMLSYGINHIANDIVVRAGQVPDIPRKLLQHTAVFNLYAPEEGMLRAVQGLRSVPVLKSFISMNQVVPIGAAALFAKNNGDPILEVTLSHHDPKQVQLDIAELERSVNFIVDSHSSTLSRTVAA